MRKSRSPRAIFTIFVLTLSLVSFGQPDNRASAQSTSSQYFPETGHSLTGTFLDYWNAHGGLAQFGYPISDELQERSDSNGQTYTVQYFERALFEHHPENAGTPYEVLLSLLGSQQYVELYGPDGASDQTVSTDNPRFFPETDHTIGGPFRTYWEAHGGLMQQGYPISDQFVEVSDLDGKPYTVQYFERSVFELHPENAGTDQYVQLTQLGNYAYQARYGELTIPPPQNKYFWQVGVSASNRYIVWGETVSPLSQITAETTDIYAYGIRYKNLIKVATIFGGEANAVDTSISGSTVIWVTTSDDANDGHYSRYSIMGMNLPSGTPYLIYSGLVDIGKISIVGENVVWVETDDNNTRFMLKNLTTQKLETLQAFSYGPYPPVGVPQFTSLVLSGEYAVWSYAIFDGSSSNNFHYYINALDLRTRQTQSVYETWANAKDCCYSSLAMSGSDLIWSGSTLHFADLQTGEVSILYFGESNSPVIFGNTVVWTAYEPVTGRPVGIWGLRLTDRIPRQLAISNTDHGNPAAIVNGWLFVASYRLAAFRLSDAFSGP